MPQLKKVTNAKKRKLKKPWISNGILKSIKTKQQMFKTHFFSHDQAKVNFFKKYNNKLNMIKEMAKRTYFSTQFYLNKENIKITWKLIGMIINRKKKSNIIIPKLLYSNRCYTHKRSICEQLNTYFINVGPTLSAQLPIHRNSDPSKYISGTFSNSFFFSPIHEYEVRDLIVILKENKSTLGCPVKYGCGYIYKALTKVFNQSLEQGIIPDILKFSKITPVDKGGDITDPTNYHPILILSVFTQIFEKLV